jgi:CRP/FNR family transcriptional regulator
VKLSADSENGRTLILEIAGSEEILGLSSVIAGEPYDKTATALTLCRVAFLPISDFNSMLLNSPRALMLALSELNRSYKQACNQIQMLGEPSVPARLARMILWWARDGKQTERGHRFHLPLNHSEIGEYIGACRETVTRVLGEFNRSGLIETKGSLVSVIDEQALMACAGVADSGTK